MNARIECTRSASSLEVRARLAEAMKLDLVGSEAYDRTDLVAESNAINPQQIYTSLMGWYQ